MPENLKPTEPTPVHPNPAPTSPFHYGSESEEESNRQKALERADDGVPNAPFRPIL